MRSVDADRQAFQRLAALLVVFLGLANQHAVLQLADCLVGPADDLLAVLEARQNLEVLLAGDPDLYGTECDFVVRPDHEHTLDVLLSNLLGVRRAPKRDRGRVGVLELLVLADRERDDRNR